MPLVSPDVAFKIIGLYIEDVRHCQFILMETSPNAQSVINSPLPRLIEYLNPCREVDIRLTRAFSLLILLIKNFGEFPLKDKAETLPNKSLAKKATLCHPQDCCKDSIKNE